MHVHSERRQQEAKVTDWGPQDGDNAGFLELSGPSCTSCLWMLGDTQEHAMSVQ